MTPQEHELVADLFDRLATLEERQSRLWLFTPNCEKVQERAEII